jgi:hypothetical protein
MYCERAGPGLLAEPLNALTNLAFLVAAAVLWRAARRHDTAGDAGLRLLLGLLVLVGLASLAFHTTAHPLAGAADVLAILSCLTAAVHLGARRWLGQGPWSALLWPAGLVVAGIVFGIARPMPGAAYLGPLVAGAAFAAALWRAGHPAAGWIAGAAALFLPALLFRTIDLAICADLPVGTHFLWHVLNAGVLGLAIAPFARRL